MRFWGRFMGREEKIPDRITLTVVTPGFNAALNNLAEQIGDGLQAIAVALSTPHENSAQVLEMAAKVKAVREKLKTSVDSQDKGD